MATVPNAAPGAGAALLVLALLLVGGCKSVTSGVVISRSHESAYSYMTMSCGSTDYKTGACLFYTSQIHEVPESWQLCLRDDSEDKPIKDQSQGCVDVEDSKTWDHYPVGSHYP